MRVKSKINIDKVFVLGANSDIAKAICEELASNGCKNFDFLVRDVKKIKIFSNYLCKKYNVNIEIKEQDLLTDFDPNYLLKIANKDYDLFLITAGFLGDTSKAEEDINEVSKIIRVNFSSIIYLLNTIINQKRIEQKGRLWVFSSVASDRGRPSNYYYGAAKVGLQIFCEGLLLRCYGKPFSIRIIKAGYMYTPMTINKIPSKFCIKPTKVAKILLRNPNKRGVEYLPWIWSIIMLIVKLLPSKIASKL